MIILLRGSYARIGVKDNLQQLWSDDYTNERELGLNQFGIRCGMCGDLYYVDEATKARIAAADETGPDNPFQCEDCETEYDDLAYEG